MREMLSTLNNDIFRPFSSFDEFEEALRAAAQQDLLQNMSTEETNALLDHVYNYGLPSPDSYGPMHMRMSYLNEGMEGELDIEEEFRLDAEEAKIEISNMLCQRLSELMSIRAYMEGHITKDAFVAIRLLNQYAQEEFFSFSESGEIGPTPSDTILIVNDDSFYVTAQTSSHYRH